MPQISLADSSSSKIVFASDRDGKYLQIYLMNPNGSNQTRLTYNNANDHYPSWSPDGTKIVFVSDRDGNPEIYVINADGTNQTRLTNNSAGEFHPRWSPDGTEIAFVSNRDGNNEIYIMNPDGTGQTPLTNNPANDDSPFWSPDGTKIVFTSSRSGTKNVYVMNADGTNPKQQTSGRWADYTGWSPDGTKIAFSDRGAIWVMKADGTNQTPVLNFGCCISPYMDSWSPDGTKIVFDTDRFDGNYEIYAMNSDGSGITRLTYDNASDYEASWSPIRAILEVAIDIKPGSFPNSINLGSGGTVPVAIFSTTSFDATTVDHTTITLASAPVKLKGQGTPMVSFEDVNKDSLLDLVVHVSTLALQLGETDTEAILEGTTFDETHIRGVDTVRVVP